MPDIRITVENKIAESDGAIYVCGNSDFVAVFVFDGEWDAYDAKTARFAYDGGYIDVVFTGSRCNVPVINNTYFFNIGVYAGNLHTTTAARVPCRKSILCSGGVPADPPESVYNQLMERIAELEAPDWAQNDATKKDYIKNRTHWVDDDGTVHKLDAKFLPLGGGGTDDHQQLINRDAADAHPISSITGLNDKLTKLKTFIISVTYVGANTYISDKTFVQILAAYNAGQQISVEVANYPDIQSPITLALTMHNGTLFVFSGTITDGNGHKVISAYVHDTDVWDVTLDTLTDGKDGITPTIGDDDNWYLGTTDTGKPSRGAKGDKGDPGKDGAGMDVTGATVGQIAKISAVDDNGVPTAWLPVDMPSGGGGGSSGAVSSYRVVADITLAEQTDRVNINTDKNGNVFELAEVYCRVDAQSYDSTSGAITFLPNGKWTGGDAYIDSASISSKVTDNWFTQMVFHAVAGDSIIVAEQLPAKGANNNLQSKLAFNQAKLTSLSFVGKLNTGCRIIVLGR